MIISSVRGRCLGVVLVGAIALGAVRDVGAQTRSALVGTIRSTDGAPLVGATLTLATASAPAETLTTATTGRGRYRFPALPPGVYDLTATRAGLQTVQRTGVRVPVGTTLTVDLTLSATETGILTVSGAGPMVDVTAASSATKLTTEDLENLPITGANALLFLVPGITPRAAFGSPQDSNQFVVDGGPVSFALRQGNSIAAMHVYWMTDVRVAGLGATADLGEATGVVASLALRSGSNRLSGLAEHRTTQPDWVGDNTSSLPETLRSQFRPQEVLSRWASVAQIGGPVKRDRLFFFSGFKYNREELLQAGTVGDVPLDLRAPAFLTTLQWVPRANVRVEGHLEADRERTKGGLGRNALPETAGDATTSRRTWNARATWTVNRGTLVEFHNGGFNFSNPGLPADRRAGPPPRFDRVRGISSGNAGNFTDRFGNRTVTGATVTRWLDGFGGRSHELNAGVELERTTFRTVQGIPGGRSFQDAAGIPEQVVLWDGETVEGSGTRTTIYLQDAWSATNRLSIHPGLRIGFYRGSVPDNGTVFNTNPISPRLGVAWDVAADHRTVVRAAYGRFHEGLYTSLFDFLNTSNLSPRITAVVLANGTFQERQRITPGNVAVDPDLAHAYIDQYVVGVERELFQDVSLTVQYIRRNFDDIWAFIDTGSRYTPVERRDPGPDGLLGTPDDGGLITVFNLLNPNQSFSVLTNPDEAFRRYDAVQAIGQKYFSRNWQLLAAYTWSRTRGNVNPGNGDSRASGGDTGRGGVFANPNRRINAEGRTNTDLPHQLTVQGTWMLPFWGGVNLSGGYSYLSGAPWGRIATITGLQLNQTVRLEPRGTRQTEAAYRLDMRLEKTFRLGGSRSMGIYLDVFNVTNHGVPLAAAVVEASGATFGEPSQWATPRTLQAAARFRF